MSRGAESRAPKTPNHLQRKPPPGTVRAVATTGRSYGGPSEKFVGDFGGEFLEEKLPPNFSEVAFMWKSPDATHFGATS